MCSLSFDKSVMSIMSLLSLYSYIQFTGNKSVYMLISSRIGEAENKIKIHFKHMSPKIFIGYDLICSYPKIFFSTKRFQDKFQIPEDETSKVIKKKNPFKTI